MALSADDSCWQPLFAALNDLRPAQLPSLGYQGTISNRSHGGRVSYDSIEGLELDDLQVLSTLHLHALPADPGQLTDLKALEYLSADLAVWRELLDAGAIPPGLKAAGFHQDADHDWPAQLSVINALLALRGQRPVTTRRSGR